MSWAVKEPKPIMTEYQSSHSHTRRTGAIDILNNETEVKKHSVGYDQEMTDLWLENHEPDIKEAAQSQ